jgi:hypothetical protein
MIMIMIIITIIKEDDVGETCGTHGGGERCLQGFGGEARR